MDDREAKEAARVERAEAIRRNDEIEADRQGKEARYRAMPAHVEAWDPPTGDHQTFKEFMLDQLNQSIQFDCGEFSMPVPEELTGKAWRAKQATKTKEQIAATEARLV